MYSSTTDKNRHEITLPKEFVAISQKTAELFGVNIGDKIRCHIYGNETWINSTVDAIYGDPSVQGITISTDVAAKNDIDFKASEIVTKEKVTEKPESVSSVT